MKPIGKMLKSALTNKNMKKVSVLMEIDCQNRVN